MSTFNPHVWTSASTSGLPLGCEECNRDTPKPWPIYTVNYHGVEVCAKCMTPMAAGRRKRDA